MLYETSGSQATCNLSMISQDQNTIENYNSDYFVNNLSKVYSTFDNVKTDFTIVNGSKLSWTTYDVELPTNNGEVQAESITLTALHNGNRYMLIINVPKGHKESIVDDIQVITRSLTFE